MKILCENQFCIHFKKSRCGLKTISLDELGNCEKILLVEIEAGYLTTQRKKLRKKLLT